MPTFTIHLTTSIPPTFRSQQIAGMFDLSADELESRLAHTLTAELPGLDEDWTIGAIVGPSGSGKTTLARAAYGDAVHEPSAWPEDLPVIECLDAAPKAPTSGRGAKAATSGRGVSPVDVAVAKTAVNIDHFSPISATTGRGFERPSLKDLLRVLGAVGLSSPPSWLRPYRSLSTGERFRADLARALIGVRGSGFETEGRQSGVATSQTPHNPEPRVPSPALLVCDEFTSTLDRITACTASASLAKYLRQAKGSEVRGQGSGRDQERSALNPEPRTLNPPLRFVCLSCHTDILPWLAPDWVLDLSNHFSPLPHPHTLTPGARVTECESVRVNGQAAFRPYWPRGSLQRPTLRFAVRRVPQAVWPRFARHHYLSGGLSTAATCYGAFWEDGELRSADCGMRIEEQASIRIPQSEIRNQLPIAFCAALATLGWKRTKRISRLVVLPEFQGLGIGGQLAERVAEDQHARGNRVTITASHPAIVAWCSSSPRWRYTGLKKTGSTRQHFGERTIRCSSGRAVASFEYVPPTA